MLTDKPKLIVRNVARPSRSKVAGVAFVASLTLTACGGSPEGGEAAQDTAGADVISQAEDLSGQERIDFLMKAASDEDGPLRLYTSYSEESLGPVVQAFEDAYGIDVEAYRAASGDILQRVQQESDAGFESGADIIEARGSELFVLAKEGLFRSVDGDFLDKVPDYGRGDGWTADRLNVIVPCWNTDSLPSGEQPKSYEELADSKWKGRLAIEQSDSNWFETMFQYMVDRGMSEQEVEDYFRAVVANAGVVKGHTQMQQLVVAGQYAAAMDCYTYVTDQQQVDGAPTAWLPAVEPAVSQPNGVAVMKGADHPASAALFFQWILTDGQQVLADTGNTPVTQPVDADVIPLDIEGYTADAEKWNSLYDDILHGAGG